MFIKKIKLKNFRNYKEAEVDFDEKVNIIYGNNAEGKTNLLEAIFLCSIARSQRNVKDQEQINFDEDEAHIKTFFFDGDDKKQQIVDIQINKNIKKGIALNGKKVEKIKDFLGKLNVVFFSPEDLKIINDSPNIRRRYIDIELCQTENNYISIISEYNKILNQRNALLKEIFFSNSIKKEELYKVLEVYDEKIIKQGIKVIEIRKKSIEEIEKNVKEIYKNISEKKEEIKVLYSNNIINEKKENEKIEEKYKELLNFYKKEEIEKKRTIIGPHRDDILFFIKNKEAKKYGSQGQKKTIAISLKISELKKIEEKTKKTPVLLLDDVFSELDETRQKKLIENIKGIQTIITCTGIKKNIYDILKPNKVFYIKDNKISEIK